MQAYHFDVYDIDGTLTIPGHDLWYLSTRSLSADKDLFDRYVAEWKTEIQSGMDPFECSLTMMKRGLKLLNNGVSSERVGHEVQRITSNLIDEGLVWREAIDFVKGRIHNGVGAVFSTTNYHEGAVGFLHALMPGFMSSVGTTIGPRMRTVTAWVEVEESDPLRTLEARNKNRLGLFSGKDWSLPSESAGSGTEENLV